MGSAAEARERYEARLAAVDELVGRPDPAVVTTWDGLRDGLRRDRAEPPSHQRLGRIEPIITPEGNVAPQWRERSAR